MLARKIRKVQMVALALFAVCSAAQSQSSFTYSHTDSSDSGPQRNAVVVKDGKVYAELGGWTQWRALRAYAVAHATLAGGNFTLFSQGDSAMHLLTDAQANADLRTLYEPMQALNAEQHALSLEQKPLGEQQAALGGAMRSAGTPAAMAVIGREQGKIGREQGRIGQKQGAVGRKQGELGRRLYERLTAVTDACLKDNTCPVVTP